MAVAVAANDGDTLRAEEAAWEILEGWLKRGDSSFAEK